LPFIFNSCYYCCAESRRFEKRSADQSK
jgi:hypothetical protein